jgi:branched-chain amino acid transport system permease protein
VIAAIGGIAFVVLNGGIEPSQGAWDQSGLILVMLIIGGTRTLYGGFIGAFIYVFAQNYLTQSFANSWQVYMGAIFVLTVLVLPGGIAGGVRLAITRLTSSVRRREQTDAEPSERVRELEENAGERVVGVSE